MIILPHVRAGDEAAATRIYVDALYQKLRPFFASKEAAVAFLAPHLRHDRAATAILDDRLVGVAGFKHAGTGLFEPGFRHFRDAFGLVGALLRMAGLALLEKAEDDDALPMDGIAVAPDARGLGVGTALLDAVAGIAAREGYSGVRLDVIDTNPRARALYERTGFVAGETRHFTVLKPLFGFSSATTLVRPVAPDSEARQTRETA
ncbi:GNAT family N-acetyltransferase [Stappia sp.]|uniref:GNAT family N-acetyltransferase n=1 Tax=Stappia sp. TaxID=1870903 RepID=UPI0032D9AB2E